MIHTTLNKIRAHNPCAGGWAKLLRHLGKTRADDEPLALATILDSNGLDDALWCLRAVDGHQREMRLFAVWCARQVQHLMADPRSVAALDVAERYANGQATDDELTATRAAAEGAAEGAAEVAAGAAADAAEAAARAAAWEAVRAAARYAARATAWAAAGAATAAAEDAARDAAGVAAWAAARDAAEAAARAAAEAAARAAQEAEFRRVFCQEDV